MSMLAAAVTDFGKPLELRTVPIPEPGPGQVLVPSTCTRPAAPG
jgi:propanol-preferring alcohol dehydrogenase